MVSLLAFRSPLFPFDPAIDTPMEHRHLLLIYCAEWGVQLLYAAFIAYKWRSVVKDRARGDRGGWR